MAPAPSPTKHAFGTATGEAPARTLPRAAELEVVLTLPVPEYEAVGRDIASVRKQLGLPAWSTPTEVITRALREQAGSTS